MSLCHLHIQNLLYKSYLTVHSCQCLSYKSNCFEVFAVKSSCWTINITFVPSPNDVMSKYKVLCQCSHKIFIIVKTKQCISMENGWLFSEKTRQNSIKMSRYLRWPITWHWSQPVGGKKIHKFSLYLQFHKFHEKRKKS